MPSIEMDRLKENGVLEALPSDRPALGEQHIFVFASAGGQYLKVQAARTLEYAQVELRQDGIEMIEYVGLDAFVGSPGCRVGEAVDLERQPLGTGRKLTNHNGHCLMHARMVAQVGLYIGAESPDIGRTARVGGDFRSHTKPLVPLCVAFAPIVGLLLGLSAITVPWGTLVLSVVLYIVIQVIIAQIMRRRLLASGGQAALDGLLAKLGPASLVALLATLVLLFGFQGEQIIIQPAIIGLLAVPILIQVYFNSGLAYLLNRLAGELRRRSSALIGASNFFELAVAAAISLLGFQSGAALATVVGVLIEVPVMLSVVWIVNRSKGWYERDAGLSPTSKAHR